MTPITRPAELRLLIQGWQIEQRFNTCGLAHIAPEKIAALVRELEEVEGNYDAERIS